MRKQPHFLRRFAVTAAVALALCGASDSDTQKRIDAILAEHGAGAFARHFLRGADLDWAADLLADFADPLSPEGE